MLRTAIVACVSFACAVVYARVATAYHLPFPPDWLGHYVCSDCECAHDTASLVLFIDAQVLGLSVWLLFRALGKRLDVRPATLEPATLEIASGSGRRVA